MYFSHFLLIVNLIIIILFIFSSITTVSARKFYSNDESDKILSKKILNEELTGNDIRSYHNAPKLRGIPTHQYFSALDSPGTISNRGYHEDHVTYFVSVASFRDPECVQSVTEIFSNAINPRRIFLGIIEQNEHQDLTCIPPEFLDCQSADFCPLDNIRRRRVVSTKGKGPTYGRYISMLSYRGEHFYMMIDSHTGFIAKWDRRMLQSLRKARSNRPVLSHYPHKWVKEEPKTRESQSHVAVMCNGHYVIWGFIRLDGRMFARANEPFPSPFAAAGYLFADAQLVKHVPFDPLLDFLFDGEEVLYSARMFTTGYDVFAPEMSYVFHSYGRRNASKYWGTQNSLGNRSIWQRAVYWARKRVQYFLKVTEANTTRLIVPKNITVGRIRWNEQKFGLGNARSLDAFNKFAMVDPIHRNAPANFCGKVAAQKRKT